ncbi:hypothetical protein [Algoriphagus sp. AK58]|uniref:hypothetical protein n=1 Tax=Algoriphagus sp. AK58 TaxID=1406877 RepID=UPI00164FEB4D|nr:hypothetical protein [Algoriphagus sp. AK58]
MEKDLITLALQEIILKEGKSIQDVKQYLRMRFRMEVDDLVLSKRLERVVPHEKAVA